VDEEVSGLVTIGLIHCMFYCSRREQTANALEFEGVDDTGELKELSEAEQVQLLKRRLELLEKRSALP